MDEVEVKAKEPKQLLVRVSRRNGSLFEVYYDNGGELPKELTGQYTSTRIAKAAIDAYLAERDKK